METLMEANKTPLKKLIEQWELTRQLMEAATPGSSKDAGLDLMIKDAKEMLEEERLAIQRAFYEGMLCQGFDPNMGRADAYYKATYPEG